MPAMLSSVCEVPAIRPLWSNGMSTLKSASEPSDDQEYYERGRNGVL